MLARQISVYSDESTAATIVFHKTMFLFNIADYSMSQIPKISVKYSSKTLRELVEFGRV